MGSSLFYVDVIVIDEITVRLVVCFELFSNSLSYGGGPNPFEFCNAVEEVLVVATHDDSLAVLVDRHETFQVWKSTCMRVAAFGQGLDKNRLMGAVVEFRDERSYGADRA